MKLPKGVSFLDQLVGPPFVASTGSFTGTALYPPRALWELRGFTVEDDPDNNTLIITGTGGGGGGGGSTTTSVFTSRNIASTTVLSGVDNQIIIVDSSAAAVSVTLSTDATVGQITIVKSSPSDARFAPITVLPGAGTIDTLVSWPITNAFNSAAFQKTATAWRVIATDVTPDPRWPLQGDWYVDNAGDDKQPGDDPSRAIRTNAEVERRMAGRKLQSDTTTFHYVNAPVDTLPRLEAVTGATILYEADPITIRSSTIQSIVRRSYASNTEFVLVDSALPASNSAQDDIDAKRRVRMTNGIAGGAVSFFDHNFGSKTFAVGEFATLAGVNTNPVLSLPADVLNGDAYVVEELLSVTVPDAIAADDWFVAFYNLRISNTVASYAKSGVTFTGCAFDNINFAVTGFSTVAQCFTSSYDVNNGAAGEVFAGVHHGEILQAQSGFIKIYGYAKSSGASIYLEDAVQCGIEDAYVVRSLDAGVVVGRQLTTTSNGGSKLTVTGELFGFGNLRGIDLGNMCEVNITSTSVPKITGSSGDGLISGKTTAWAQDPTTGMTTGVPIAFTWNAFNTSVAGGGFGSSLVNPFTGTRMFRYAGVANPGSITNGYVWTMVAGIAMFAVAAATTVVTTGGDLSGLSNNATVIKIHGATVPTIGTPFQTLRVNSGQTALEYSLVDLTNGVSGTLPVGNLPGVGGDLTGTVTSATVAKVNGAPITTIGGANTVPQVNGAGTSLIYGPINLAVSVTGTLSVGNLPGAGGDLSGTLSSATVIKVHGATVPTIGTPFQTLRVNSGATALEYSLVDLTNGVSGQLPAANIANPGGDIGGTYGAMTVNAISGASPIKITAAILEFEINTSAPRLTQQNRTLGNGQTLLIQPQSTSAASGNGGGLALFGGAGGASGVDGAVSIEDGSGNPYWRTNVADTSLRCFRAILGDGSVNPFSVHGSLAITITGDLTLTKAQCMYNKLIFNGSGNAQKWKVTLPATTSATGYDMTVIHNVGPGSGTDNELDFEVTGGTNSIKVLGNGLHPVATRIGTGGNEIYRGSASVNADS